MKKFIFVLATLISVRSFAYDTPDSKRDIKKDLMKITCYTGSGRYMQEVITGQRESPYKPFIIKATWQEQGHTVEQDLKVDFVGEMGVTYVTGITIQGWDQTNPFEITYNAKTGNARVSYSREEKFYRSAGGVPGLTCIGIFRNQ